MGCHLSTISLRSKEYSLVCRSVLVEKQKELIFGSFLK